MNFDNIEVSDRLLIRREASEKLQEWFGPVGYLCPSTLARLAVFGDGPPMLKFGRKVCYPERELFDWARSRARRVTSSSDEGNDI